MGLGDRAAVSNAVCSGRRSEQEEVGPFGVPMGIFHLLTSARSPLCPNREGRRRAAHGTELFAEAGVHLLGCDVLSCPGSVLTDLGLPSG